MVAHHPQSNGHLGDAPHQTDPSCLSNSGLRHGRLTPSTYRNRSVSRPWAQCQKIEPGPSTFSWSNTQKKRTNSCNPGKWEQAPKKSGDLKFFDLQFILMFIIQFGQSYPTSHYIPLPPHWFSSDSWNSWLPSFLLAGVFGEFGSFEVSWNMMFSGLGFRRCQVLPWRHLGQGRDVRKMWMKSPSKNMRKAQPIELMLSSWLDVAVD